jgi:hypothetical protein
VGLNISNLYALIHTVLREDSQIKSLLGLSANPTLAETATKIQKRIKPQNLASENLPLISFYTNPGIIGSNHLDYTCAIDFDVYTGDDVELALAIVDRIQELFDGQYPGLGCGSYFKARFNTCSEVETDLPNTYKFFVQVLFSMALEEQ